MNINGSVGYQHDNLNKKKLVATRRVIGSANINYNPSQKFGITLNYSNFGTAQAAGTKSINDTTKIDQISQSITLVPRLTLMKKDNKHLHNIVPTFSFQNLNDRNKLNSSNYEMKNINANVNYAFAYIPKKLNANMGLNTNYTIVAVGKTLSYGFTTGATYTFAKDKLTATEQFTWNKNAFNKMSNGSTMQNTFNLSYQIVQHHSLSTNIILTKNKAIDQTINPSFTEFTGMVTYSLTY